MHQQIKQIFQMTSIPSNIEFIFLDTHQNGDDELDPINYEDQNDQKIVVTEY